MKRRGQRWPCLAALNIISLSSTCNIHDVVTRLFVIVVEVEVTWSPAGNLSCNKCLSDARDFLSFLGVHCLELGFFFSICLFFGLFLWEDGGIFLPPSTAAVPRRQQRYEFISFFLGLILKMRIFMTGESRWAMKMKLESDFISLWVVAVVIAGGAGIDLCVWFVRCSLDGRRVEGRKTLTA